MPVLLHKFLGNTEYLPPGVRELAQLISRPLPVSLARVEASGSIAQKQLNKLSLQQCDLDGTREDREPLHDILNIVLLTSAGVAGYAQIALDGGDRRRTSISMFSLFRTLATACWERCYITGVVPFIWPRGFDADRGVATMLISLEADDSVIRLKEAKDDETLVDGSSDDASSESVSDLLLRLPLCTQILTGKSFWPSVNFPVICIADSSNIVAHVASVAYQRRVWGIELPVVGLEVHPLGTGVRVHIGWLDPPSDDGRLPAMHILKPVIDARGLTAKAAAAQGVFDLADTHSAFLFAQFFLALRPHFEHLWNNISAQNLSRLEWRSDCIDAMLDADIEEWAHGIDRSDDSGASASSPAPSESSSADHLTVDNAGGPKESNALSSVEAKSRTCSASAFAQLQVEKDVKGDASVMTWLAYRLAFLDTKYTLDGYVGPPLYEGQGKYEGMCRSYDDTTSFRWIEEWSELEDLPAVRASLEELRRGLHDQYRRLHDESWAKVYADKEHAKIISSKLDLLLAIVSGALAQTPDSVARQNWDAMLSHFYVKDEDEMMSQAVLFEREIRMPRNALLDALDDNGSELCHNMVTRFKVWADRNKAIDMHAAETLKDHPFSLQCRDTRETSDDFVRQYEESLREPKLAHDIVLKQAEVEPVNGICDAVLFTHLPMEAGVDISPRARETYEHIRLVMENTDSNEPSRTQVGHPDRDLDLYPLATMNKYVTEVSPLFEATLREYRTRNIPPGIVLPQLVAVYSKAGILEALNEARMYCVAAVESLAAVGIQDYPVFGLVVEGNVGHILMTWMSDEGTTHIFERNIRRFDLANPLQALQCATFLLRLKAREKELRRRFDGCRADLLDNLENGRYKDWAVPLSGLDFQRGLKASTSPDTDTRSTVDKSVVRPLVHDSADSPAVPAANNSPNRI